MTGDETSFEKELADSLGRLAGAAPAGPGSRQVLGALRRRQVRRGLVASATACAVLAAGLWAAWIASPERTRPGPATPNLAQVPMAAPPARPAAGSALTLALPALTFQASAVAAVLPAPRTEVPPLSIPASLSGPRPAGGLDCRLPALSFALGRVNAQPTP
jgi:hypothetical protein